MELNLLNFTQLLLPVEVIPADDFNKTGILYFHKLPSIEDRAKIRFIFQHKELTFLSQSEEKINLLIKSWRVKLTPNIDNEEHALDAFDEDDLSDLSSDAPVIKVVNHLFERALDLNASDIHFEPEASGLFVRCRVDGIMTVLKILPLQSNLAVSSRLKLMSKLDIGEKRLPQDGRIELNIGQKNLDFRVSTLPGIHGESIVLRILDRSDIMVSLDDLGMPGDVLKSYNELIHQPHGMILVTGPTGSGKTTTMYATLEKINSQEQKIITVEDPVEYQLDGVTQIQVNSKIGLDFASGLRSIVRQDPDIIMIGEIRDHETASIGIESALTGHMVFSTLHTNDAAGAITRMQDMGIESYLLSSSILAIQAQRLVRKICEFCRYETILTEVEAELLGVSKDKIPKIYHGKGCSRCANTGYSGRLGLYELLIITDSIRNLINNGADAKKICQQAISEGMEPLRFDALNKLASGFTSPEEVIRVTKAV